jgi:hypothetical protein
MRALRGVVKAGGLVVTKEGPSFWVAPEQGFEIGDKVWACYDFTKNRVRKVMKRGGSLKEGAKEPKELKEEAPQILLEELNEWPSSVIEWEVEERPTLDGEE